MRILHAPKNIAGQASIISRAQRRLGHQSDVLVYYQNYYNYESDINLNLEGKSFVIYGLVLLKTFIICCFKYDIFHFHFGYSFLPSGLDLWILKKLGKKVVMEYWGSDVIQTDIALRYTNWTKKDLAKIYPKANDEAKRRKLARISRWVNKTIVGDYSLLPYSPKSLVVRQAIDLENLPYIGSKNQKTVTIIHAPSNRAIKGTKYIIEAIERLKKEKYPIKFILVEKKPRKEALEIYKKADIVIDAVLQGAYGILAIECMALGKPVLCYINEIFKKYYKNLPIVNSNPTNLYDNLVRLIKNPSLRERLGIESRKYVEKNHDSLKIANQFIKLYEKL